LIATQLERAPCPLRCPAAPAAPRGAAAPRTAAGSYAPPGTPPLPSSGPPTSLPRLSCCPPARLSSSGLAASAVPSPPTCSSNRRRVAGFPSALRRGCSAGVLRERASEAPARCRAPWRQGGPTRSAGRAAAMRPWSMTGSESWLSRLEAQGLAQSAMVGVGDPRPMGALRPPAGTQGPTCAREAGWHVVARPPGAADAQSIQSRSDLRDRQDAAQPRCGGSQAEQCAAGRIANSKVARP
jgi:hypothetical protein